MRSRWNCQQCTLMYYILYFTEISDAPGRACGLGAVRMYMLMLHAMCAPDSFRPSLFLRRNYLHTVNTLTDNTYLDEEKMSITLDRPSRWLSQDIQKTNADLAEALRLRIYMR